MHTPQLIMLALAGMLASSAGCSPAPDLAVKGAAVSEKQSFSEEELRQRLSAEEYRVTQQQGTEAPFTGRYWNHKEDGSYTCVVCGDTLFTSATKYDSGCGWPSFFASNEGRVTTRPDHSHGMVRTEILCAGCGAHLGHVFDDGPEPTGVRFCVNSASLGFSSSDSSETEGNKERTQP